MFSRVINYGFGAESGLQFFKRAKSSWRENSTSPNCVFSCEKVKRGRNKRKVSNVSTEEIGETQKLTDLMDISRRCGITDSS